MIALCAAASLTLAQAPTAAAATFVGKAVHVADGDTLTILVDGTQHRVRLAEIDAPERSGQPFSEASRRALAKAVVGHALTVYADERDQYGRLLGTVVVDGQNINHALVRAGYAWSYDRYLRDPRVKLYELYARAQRLGLWADPTPVPPWEWRQRTKGK